MRVDCNCVIVNDNLGFFLRIRVLGLLNTVRSPFVTGIWFPIG